MWLPQYPQGVLAPEAQAALGHFSSPSIPQWMVQPPENPLLPVIQEIGALIEKKKQDQIANQLLAVDTAPKATAVSGMQPDVTKYAPDTALTQAMIAKNLALGLPATDSGRVPDLGGMEGLKTSDLIRQRLLEKDKAEQAAMERQWQIEDRPLEQDLLRAKIKHTLQPSVVPHPPLISTKWGQMTPAQAAAAEARERSAQLKNDPDYEARLRAYYDTTNKLNTDLSAYGLSPEEMRNIDLSAPGGDEGGEGGVTYRVLRDIIDGEKTIAKAGQSLSTDEAKKLTATYGDKAAVVAQGSAAGKPFEIPLHDYMSLLNRARTLPAKPEKPAPAPASASSSEAAPTINSEEEYNALPSGATYVDGRTGRLKQKQ